MYEYEFHQNHIYDTFTLLRDPYIVGTIHTRDILYVTFNMDRVGQRRRSRFLEKAVSSKVKAGMRPPRYTQGAEVYLIAKKNSLEDKRDIFFVDLAGGLFYTPHGPESMLHEALAVDLMSGCLSRLATRQCDVPLSLAERKTVGHSLFVGDFDIKTYDKSKVCIEFIDKVVSVVYNRFSDKCKSMFLDTTGALLPNDTPMLTVSTCVDPVTGKVQCKQRTCILCPKCRGPTEKSEKVIADLPGFDIVNILHRYDIDAHCCMVCSLAWPRYDHLQMTETQYSRVPWHVAEEPFGEYPPDFKGDSLLRILWDNDCRPIRGWRGGRICKETIYGVSFHVRQINNLKVCDANVLKSIHALKKGLGARPTQSDAMDFVQRVDKMLRAPAHRRPVFRPEDVETVYISVLRGLIEFHDVLLDDNRQAPSVWSDFYDVCSTRVQQSDRVVGCKKVSKCMACKGKPQYSQYCLAGCMGSGKCIDSREP